MDARDMMSVFARMNGNISFLCIDSDCSLSDETTDDLIDALQSPCCRLTDFFCDRELALMLRGGWSRVLSLLSMSVLVSVIVCQPEIRSERT